MRKYYSLFVVILWILPGLSIYGQVSSNGHSCPDDNHPHMIDLGLPSGTKWACCNVGAAKPEEYGNHYAWGSNSPIWAWDNGGWGSYSLYDSDAGACRYIGDDIAGTEYDVAHVNWGGDWCMPTENQFQELLENCTSIWEIIGDDEGLPIYGFRFTAPNGVSIVLPCAGSHFGMDGDRSLYWTSSSSESSIDKAKMLLCGSDCGCEMGEEERWWGYSVRPVVVEAPVIVNICPDDNHPHMIDLGLPSGTKWACCNVDTDYPENQNPTNYGGHYAWGETGVKSEYTVYSYAHFDIDEDNFIFIGDHIGNTEYDVAHVAWKGSWQMPTDEECDELMDCVQEETTINGVKGLKIIGPNDNFIFLPYAGYRYETELTNQGSSGWYWTETYNDGQWSQALGIPMSVVDVEPREIGHSVRPVIAGDVSTISVTSAGMATYCSPYDLDFRNVTNLKAYIITGYDWQGKRVYATRVYDVPAGIGIYLVGDEGVYDVPRGASTSYYTNMLVGTLEETWIEPTDGDFTNLRLTGTSPQNASFKTFTQGRTFSANRAYLQIPTALLNTSANAVDIVFDDETDGIDGISQNIGETDNNWFTLDGRKLSGKPTTKGVYVVNGRKVVVK